MEVKIGISDSPRELVINSAQTQEEVEALVSGAFGGDGGVLSLSDEKGRKFLIQAAKVAYVEIGSTTGGRVGFAAV
ncbi:MULTISPECIES: DUF3107 domain-containing protein [Nocardia]|uniref:DUF3107 domain-containing protein n=1 Tax=Nocardia abscessus TaxID=120957 RepID=A0ABS0CCV5_9NOCA|nr:MULTISPECIES: DUF3107 domain-containing protein [Nocardia]MBF6218228.1 DUF3107 domain-containing protein [Nocardia abscessus]MBF6228188.1 DUF3107 domain-containing protein [Nocardia abscessus]MBF6337055.1 DUF3107 domain-containing protein [Nocardia abscessus]MBF6471324.1 DUF3107 domain-containing protein [Nocardia abscessus]MCC3329292.1 DUF3107 domain-containing protein [Nocardia abscessus]